MQKVEIRNGIPYLETQYDESMTLVAPITAGTPITLPGGESFEGEELYIVLNGQSVEFNQDYIYVGAGPTYTQISFLFDLIVGDILRFRT